jgi:hypothetical protein
LGDTHRPRKESSADVGGEYEGLGVGEGVGDGIGLPQPNAAPDIRISTTATVKTCLNIALSFRDVPD